MEKRKNNKGFSLVELIVVVAIMAVLMTVLAPQLLRYVEKTRLQKDNSAIAEIANAVKIAAADERINNEIADATTLDGSGNITAGITITAALDANGVQVFTMSSIADVSGSPTVLETELIGVFPENVTMTSNTYNAVTAAADCVTLTVGMNASGVVEVVADNWANNAGDPTVDDLRL